MEVHFFYAWDSELGNQLSEGLLSRLIGLQARAYYCMWAIFESVRILPAHVIVDYLKKKRSNIQGAYFAFEKINHFKLQARFLKLQIIQIRRIPIYLG